MPTLIELIKAYEKWVSDNPNTVFDLEVMAKWLSYIISGRISDSVMASEMVHALSNIMTMYHDRIIQNSQINKVTNLDAHLDQRHCYRLKCMLTILEYCEMFVEISAKRLFGSKGKWLIIATVQLVKALGRLHILQHSNEPIIMNPILPRINRRALLKESKTTNATSSSKAMACLNDNIIPEHKIVFKLKRSGRIMRKVEGAPPLQCRSFNLMNEACIPIRPQEHKQLLQAEYIYVLKPLIHLINMGMFGEKSWKPYIISLAMDLCSIQMYYKHYHLMSKKQRITLSRRYTNLLIYLMRSPFYDYITQYPLNNLLTSVIGNIPIIRMTTDPLKMYIKFYQSMYFYLWST